MMPQEMSMTKIDIADLGPIVDTDEWAESMTKIAKYNICRDNYLAPVLLFLFQKESNSINMGTMNLSAFIDSRNGKDTLSTIAPEMLDSMNAYATLIVSTASAIEINKDIDIAEEKEVVTVIYETLTKTVVTNIDIERDGEKVILGHESRKELSEEELETVSGSMTGWLRKFSGLVQ